MQVRFWPERVRKCRLALPLVGLPRRVGGRGQSGRKMVHRILPEKAAGEMLALLYRPLRSLLASSGAGLCRHAASTSLQLFCEDGQLNALTAARLWRGEFHLAHLRAGKPKWPGWYPALHEPWRQRVVSGACQRSGRNAELLRRFSGSHKRSYQGHHSTTLGGCAAGRPHSPPWTFHANLR